jgi:rod shape-determining protein MreC
VGRIAGVGGHVSRIMLLTDVESRTPVMIVRTNGRAILAGDGGPDPTLAYLRTHDAPRQGDRVMTSGDGGVVPRGLPVGTVVRGFDGAWRVALDADASPIDFVRILLFKDFSQLATPAELAPRDLPVTNTEAPQEPPANAPPAASKAKAP